MSETHEALPEQKPWMTFVQKAGAPVVSVIIAIGIGSIIMWISGYDAGAAFAALFKGALGSPKAVGDTLLRATPLMFTGLAVAYGFRAGLFNIGAEGQLFIGGLAAAYLGVRLGGMSPVIALPVVLLAAMAAGAAWAFVPAVLKARIGAHEVITTMMFTYIGKYIVSWLVVGPLKAPGQIPQTEMIGTSAQLPRIQSLFSDATLTAMPLLKLGRAHMGIFVAVFFAVIVWLILKYTTLGYENRAVGYNPWASENAGISVPATIVKSLCISGALAGLAGAVEVMGVHHRIFDQFSSGFGFTGIAVALVAKNHPLGVIPAALLFGAMSAGSGTMQLEADVPQKIVLIIQALVIFLIASESVVQWFIQKRQKEALARAR
ncbi:ABC transporter permease [Coriobacteriia bacterium Es71-Z0120]|uniref:ABC transporter permease n=1 Tax=Parvivirga hydrogeniphila TaxID=2939460 RepID=UPI002260918E|nr:ABC transporter permease [Parvivirga hydrogeniphila]MCL4079119.1 ABC transporter permease [Parvivirga hydrogeniphila]